MVAFLKRPVGEQGALLNAQCSYSVRGPSVTIEWKHELEGVRAPPLELVVVRDGSIMRVEGEAQKSLRRIAP